jgi:uncharacterized membrane protein YfcA
MMRFVTKLLPWMVAGLTTAFLVGAVLVVASNPGRNLHDLLSLQAPALLFAYVGALIMTKQPENRMGWLFAAVGWFTTSGSLADEYANLLLSRGTTASPDVILATWYSEWFWIPFVFIAFGLSIVLFPTGRPLSRRWYPFLQVLTVLVAILTILAALDPRIASSIGREIDNPIGISPLGDPDEMPLTVLLVVSLWGMTIGALVSVILRFRRSRGEERQQLKLFTFSALVTVIGFMLLGTFDSGTGTRSTVLDVLVFSAVPIGAGFAILRYRLYDIDLVVNRTIVYLLLSVLLGLIYFGGVTVLQGLIGFRGESDLAVAASTLAVAGLFQPARRRIQSFIDHYFYRRKYDAQRTIDAFSVKLRDEIDLEMLNSELVTVVAHTMQPTHVSVWLPAESSGG